MVMWPRCCKIAVMLLVFGGQSSLVCAQVPLDPAQIQPGEIPTLLVINQDGTKLRKLTEPTEFDGQGSPQWSADGQEIVFDAWRASANERFTTSQVFVVKADGTELRRLIDGALPSFSPDRMYVSFSRYPPNFGTWTMARDGSDKIQISARGWCATWSPDGRSIAYTVNGGNLAVYDVTTGEERLLVQGEHVGKIQEIHWGFRWSPDSKHLCFHAIGTTPSELVVVDARGSSHGWQVLTKRNLGYKISWHPDGQQILCSAFHPVRNVEQLYVLDRRNPEQVQIVPGQPQQTKNIGPEWSSNGEQIVFSAYVTPFWKTR